MLYQFNAWSLAQQQQQLGRFFSSSMIACSAVDGFVPLCSGGIQLSRARIRIRIQGGGLAWPGLGWVGLLVHENDSHRQSYQATVELFWRDWIVFVASFCYMGHSSEVKWTLMLRSSRDSQNSYTHPCLVEYRNCMINMLSVILMSAYKNVEADLNRTRRMMCPSSVHFFFFPPEK